MTVTRLTIRALVLRRRALALLAAVGSVPFFAVLAIVQGDITPDAQAEIVGNLLVTTIAPLVALVLAATAIGDERESGTIVYLATARLSRLRVAAEKALAAAVAAVILLSPAMATSVVLGIHLGIGAGNVARGIAATALVAAAYAAVFTAVGLVLRRALVAGILYVLIWEGAIATVAPSAERISLTAWARAISNGGLVGLDRDLAPALSASTGVVVLVAVAAVAVLAAGWRLSRMDLP